jgi:PAS domain S-box-containing protein
MTVKPSRQLITGIAAATLLVALGVAVSFWTFTKMDEAAGLRAANAAALTTGVALLSSFQGADADQRGYLLTSDDALLERYLAGHDSITSDLQELRRPALPGATQKSLDALAPLLHAKLEDMSQAVALHRNSDPTETPAGVGTAPGHPLMESVRAELVSFIQIVTGMLAQQDTEFQSSLRHMLTLVVATTLLALLFALAFTNAIRRRAPERLRTLIDSETQHLLKAQEDINSQLQQTNMTLSESEEKLAVTLNSIGDAVIATDAQAQVTRLNPVAEELTGWTQAQAIGHPVDEIFHIVNQETRQPARIPVMETLAHGTVQGLANHTLLIARDGSERAIADSCAPIRDRDGRVIGAVLVFRNVTEEYAVQQALSDSAVLIQTILNTVVDGIVTLRADADTVEMANPAAERMFGYSSTELVGKDFGLLIPELDRDPRNRSLEYYSASDAARAIGRGREVIGRRKDGSEFPLEMAVGEMRLGGQTYFTGILRDITARKQAEAALLKAGSLQRAIFNSINFSSIATDARGVIQIFNVGAERMLGYAAAEVIDKVTPADISDPQEAINRAIALSAELGTPITPGFQALVFKASRGIEDIYEQTYIRKDGSRFPAVVSVTALRDAQDTIIGYLLIGTDNTARMRVEAERALLDQALQDKNIELQRAKVMAERANLAKSDFLSSMSHELRTPLSAILGFAQLMESGSPPPTSSQRRSIDQILKAGWYLLELINEILDLALIESGKLSMSLEPISLPEVMRECETMIEPQANTSGIHVAFAPLATPCFVRADRTRLKQILINLLSNSIKYNRPGGTVAVECALTHTNSVRISVWDTGAGLAPAQLAQLFQPFNRLGQEGKDKQGTGIGLVVCKRLVEWMGGIIGMESTVGQGSVFWVELGLTTEPHPEARTDKHTAIPLANIQGSVPLHTLLYVEDNPANLMLVEDIIERRPDVRLLSAKDGKSGIAIARTALPDVILMDINLPGMSGIDALGILSADHATKHIPVIALSANAVPRDIEKGLQAGFYRYLTKPIKVTEFMDTLDMALKFVKAESTDSAKQEPA